MKFDFKISCKYFFFVFNNATYLLDGNTEKQRKFFT